jgi:hypothetical protein
MITALLLSVNYADYLEVALPYNTKQFDEIIVLTIESDKACQDLCSKYSNVKCLVFPDEILKKNGKMFNKGAIINKGFEYLNKIGYSDWLVMTDSDIIFPENFKELIASKEKDTNILYGMFRAHCHTLARLESTRHEITLGKRKPNGDIFMGYCQIFICNAKKLEYSEDHNAENSDILFLTNFSEEFKQFMSNKNMRHNDTFNALLRINNFKLLSEDDFVIHLGISVRNWAGRITPLFV